MDNGEQHSGRFSIIPSVALDDPRMTPTLLRLLCVLGTYGDKHGYCRVKRTTIAARMGGVSRPAISNGLKKLKELGYLEVTARFSPEVGQLANMYRILFDVPVEPMQNNGEEMTGGSPLDVTPPSPLDVTPLNVPYERSILTLSAAAALSTPTGEAVNGVNVDAAAAAWDLKILQQTAEAVRVRLGMPLRNLDGLMDILRQYPQDPGFFIAQAAACQEKLHVRPLKLAHFLEYLRRIPAAGGTHHDPTNNSNNNTITNNTANEDKRRAAQAEAAQRRKLKRELLERLAQDLPALAE